jgi:tetratricopeptide (TPR) repeat protein
VQLLSLDVNPIKVRSVSFSMPIPGAKGHLRSCGVKICVCLIVALGSVGAVAQKNALSVESLIRQSKFAEAESRLQKLQQNKPDDPHNFFLLGELRRKQGNYFAAEKAWRMAIEANAKSAEALSALGQLYADEGKVKEAIPLVEKARAIAPTQRASAQLAELYMKAGEFEKSLKIAEAVPAPSRPDKLRPVMVADYIGLKRDADVQRAVPEILKRASVNPELVSQLAQVFLQAGMVGDAAELLKVAQSHLKPTASLLTAEANVQVRSGQREQAAATLKRALELDPKQPEALWGAARLAGAVGDWKQAVALLKRLLKSAPPSSEVLQSLVYASTQDNDLQTAHDAALDLQELEPDSLESVLVMSAVLIQGLHFGEAEALVQKALPRFPNDKRLQYAAGMAEFKLGKIDEAQAYLKAALGQGAADADVHYTLGQIAAQRGDVAAAAEQMESALAVNPKKTEVLTSLGQFYLQLNQVDKAKAMLEQAVTLAPDNAQNHYQLAMAYRRSGMNAEAQEQMKLFQQLSARHVPEPASNSATPR